MSKNYKVGKLIRSGLGDNTTVINQTTTTINGTIKGDNVSIDGTQIFGEHQEQDKYYITSDSHGEPIIIFDTRDEAKQFLELATRIYPKQTQYWFIQSAPTLKDIFAHTVQEFMENM